MRDNLVKEALDHAAQMQECADDPAENSAVAAWDGKGAAIIRELITALQNARERIQELAALADEDGAMMRQMNAELELASEKHERAFSDGWDAAISSMQSAMSVVEWFEKHRRDAIHRAATIKALPEDAAVLALCIRHGFGAVMDSAARQWAAIDPRGAFFVGGCIGDESGKAVINAAQKPTHWR